MTAQACVIRGGRLVTAGGVAEGDLVIKDGLIAAIGGAAAAGGGAAVDARGLLVLPGFVNLHVHGGCGFSATAGVFDPAAGRFDPGEAAYAERLPQMAAHLARHGVTWALLATGGAPPERLERVLPLLGRYVRGPRNGADGGVLGGVFIEGTFIKNRAYAGAQNPDNFRPPSLELFERLNRAAQDTIRYVNVTPEFGEPALALIRELTRRGVLAGAGHSACTAEEYVAAMRNGLRIAVHLLNGPTGSSFEPFGGGGALEAALTTNVAVELIADGYHVAPGAVLDVVRRKGPDQVCVVTDAIFATEAPGVTEFEIDGVPGAVIDGEYVRVKGTENTLFGSVLTMDRGFSNVLSWLTAGRAGIWRERHAAMPVAEALPLVSRFCSGNPACVLGLDEAGAAAPPASGEWGDGIGALEVGKRADVVLGRLTGEPGRFLLNVERVFIAGREMAAACREAS